MSGGRLAASPGGTLRNIDFSSWQSILTTIVGLALLALVGVGVRMLLMLSIQQRRERMNRQINERLKTLIAAYKVLGGSFTGDLRVDPTHLRDLHRGATPTPGAEETAQPGELPGAERRRRVRDAVEAALSDIILLGTEKQVRLADRVARDLVAGRSVETGELVVSLRDFIREALDLDPVPADLAIPAQGPARAAGSGGKDRQGGGDRQRGGGGGGGGAGMGGGGSGMGGGMGLGLGAGASSGEPDDPAARHS